MSYLKESAYWPSGWYYEYEYDLTHWALSIDVFRRMACAWKFGRYESGMAFQLGPFYVEGGFGYELLAASPSKENA